MNDDTRNQLDDLNAQKDELAKQSEELQKQQRIVALKADIAERAQDAQEARDVANKALADDPGGVAVAQPSAEAVRTQTLADQAERELESAKAQLAELEGNAPQEPEPAVRVDSAPPPANEPQVTTTENTSEVTPQ